MLLLISFLLFIFYFSSSLLSLYPSSSFSLISISSSFLCSILQYFIPNPFYLTLTIPICFCISSSSSFSSSHISSTRFASAYLPLRHSLHTFLFRFYFLSSSIHPLHSNFLLFISFLSYLLPPLYISPHTCSSFFIPCFISYLFSISSPQFSSLSYFLFSSLLPILYPFFNFILFIFFLFSSPHQLLSIPPTSPLSYPFIYLFLFSLFLTSLFLHPILYVLSSSSSTSFSPHTHFLFFFYFFKDSSVFQPCTASCPLFHYFSQNRLLFLECYLQILVPHSNQCN